MKESDFHIHHCKDYYEVDYKGRFYCTVDSIEEAYEEIAEATLSMKIIPDTEHYVTVTN